MRVTVIGGPMGVALARAVLRGGCAVTVWNRTASRLDGVVAEGAVRAASAAEAVRASPLVLLCLATYAAALEVLADPRAEAALGGRTIVQLGSATARQVREFAEWAEARDAAFLEGYPMVYSRQIGEPTARILFSGPVDLFEENRETFALAAPVLQYVSDELGTANRVSLPLWAFYYGAYGSFIEAAAFANEIGVPVGDYVELAEPMLEALRSSMGNAAVRLGSGEDSSIASVLRDLEGLVVLFQRKGIDAKAVASYVEYLGRAVEAGEGSADPAKSFDHVVTESARN